jgi:hypothetical protein
MDIDRLVRLATGAGVVLAGLRNPDEATAEFCKVVSTCCTGPCPESGPCGSNGKCPGGSKKRYQWFCDNGTERQLCVDCYKSGNYFCTAATTR